MSSHHHSGGANEARLVVLDCETTGFASTDRIVEFAAVVLDGEGVQVGEYDTLINPEGSVGATWVHGIDEDMVADAPTFAEVAPDLRDLLHGSLLVAHNLPFDVRFLRQEFDRLRVRFEPGQGICTLQRTGSKLSAACDRYGIRMESAHRARSDARAAAQLLLRSGRQYRGTRAEIGPVHSSRRAAPVPRD